MATQLQDVMPGREPESAPGWNGEEAVAADRYGKPKFDRRLTDKILAAYNHAYAADEMEIAEKLKVLLQEAERRELDRCARPGGSVLDRPVRRSSRAVDQAGLWSRFVDARQAYISLSIRANAPEDKLRSACLGMRNSFARWRVA